jgi:4-amino-4-deoxy-L-arabinose transferase-like glycosyltransferase
VHRNRDSKAQKRLARPNARETVHLTFDICLLTFPGVKFARTTLFILLATAAFLPFLGRRDIVISHEARVIQTAREMAHSGWPWRARPVTVPAVRLGYLTGEDPAALRLLPDADRPPIRVNPWLVPTLNNEIRLQKPPLPYWCAATAFLVAGHWSEALARVVPALLGALATLLVYDLARLTLGRRFARAAALVWVSSYFIPDEFRKVMADPYLAFFALSATWAWVRAAAARRNPVVTTSPPRTGGFVILFYVFTALGLLAKGPPLFVHLVIPIGLYHLLARRRPPGSIAAHLLGLVILLVIALPWPLFVYRHVPNALEIWRYESVGEMTDNTENARPFWFYLPNLFQISLPWTPIWLAALALPFLRRRRRSSLRSFFPLLWYGLVVLFFSCVHLKKNAYLLPATPAQALLIAQGLIGLAAIVRAARGQRKESAGLLLGIQTFIPLGFGAALFFLIPKTALPIVPRVVAAAIPIGLAAAALGPLARRRTGDWLTLTSMAAVVALVGFLNFVQTPAENARSPRNAAAYIDLALRADPTVTTLPAKLPPEATLYLPIDLAFDPRASTVLYLIDDRRGTADVSPSAFAARVPELNVKAVTRVQIPGEPPRSRYRLFALTLAPGEHKTLARGD